MSDPAFAEVKSRMGTDNLRKFITKILADKMKSMIPELRTRALADKDDAVRRLKENGR